MLRKSPKRRKRKAFVNEIDVKKIFTRNLKNLLEDLEFLYEEELTGKVPFLIHFFFSSFVGILFQHFFSSPLKIKRKCSNDTSLSFENGVAFGSIAAYVYLSASSDFAVSILMHIYNNLKAIIQLPALLKPGKKARH